MRNLREKLNAMASRPREQKPEPAGESLWIQEDLVSYDKLFGVEKSTLDEIRACDPSFQGNQWDPMHLLFLDTETTGLSGGAGTLIFLLGLGWLENNGLRVRQIMIRNYPQERKMLLAFADALKDHGTIVTFNGKSFDLPLLDSRLIMNGLHMQTVHLPHLDLLHASRRVYRMRLRKCSLRILEEAILEKRRINDLPGSEAPQRFFSYLKSGNFDPLSEVARHNLEDVISLAQLTGHLCEIFRSPEALVYPEDRYSLAKALERSGDRTRALDLYRQLSKTSLASPSHWQIAEIERRAGHPDAAAREWEAMIQMGSCGTEPYLALAKYCEYTLHDYDRAVRYAASAWDLELNRLEMGAVHNEDELNAIRKRIERLRRKQFRKTDKGG